MSRCKSYIVILLILPALLQVSPGTAYIIDHDHSILHRTAFIEEDNTGKVIWSPEKPPLVTIIIPGDAIEPLVDARIDSLDAAVYDIANKRLIRGRVHVETERVKVLGVNDALAEKGLPTSSVVGKSTLLYITIPLVPTKAEPTLYYEAWTTYHAVNRIHDAVLLVVPKDVIIETFKQYEKRGYPVDMNYILSMDSYVFMLFYDKENSLGIDNYFTKILLTNNTVTIKDKDIINNTETIVLDSYSIINNTYIINMTNKPTIHILDTIHHSSFIVSRNYAEILAYDTAQPELPPDQWYYFDGGGGPPDNQPPKRTVWFYVPIDINASNQPYAEFRIKPYQVIQEEETFELSLGRHVSYAEVITDMACFSYAYPRSYSIGVSLTIYVYDQDGKMVGQNAEILMIPPCIDSGIISYRTLVPISPNIDEPIKIHLTYTMALLVEGLIDEKIVIRPSIIMARDLEAYMERTKYIPIPNATIVYKMSGSIIKGMYSVLETDSIAINIGFPPTGLLVTDETENTLLSRYISTEIQKPAFTAYIQWDLWDHDEATYIDIYLGGARLKHIPITTTQGQIYLELSYSNISTILESLLRNGEPAVITFVTPIFTWNNAYIYIGNVTLRYTRIADLPGLDTRYTFLEPPAVLMGYVDSFLYNRDAVVPQLEGYAFIYSVGDHYTWYRVGDKSYRIPLWIMGVFVGSGTEKGPAIRSHITEVNAELQIPNMSSAALEKISYSDSAYVQGQKHKGWDEDVPKVRAALTAIGILLSLLGNTWAPTVLGAISDLLINTVASTHVEFFTRGNYGVYRVSWSSGIQTVEYIRIKIKFAELTPSDNIPKEIKAHKAVARYKVVMDTPAWATIKLPIYIITGEFAESIYSSTNSNNAPPMYMDSLGGSPLPRVW